MITEERIAAIVHEAEEKAFNGLPVDEAVEWAIRLALAEERARQPMSTVPRDGRYVLLHGRLGVGDFITATYLGTHRPAPWATPDGEWHREKTFDGWHELPEDGA